MRHRTAHSRTITLALSLGLLGGCHTAEPEQPAAAAAVQPAPAAPTVAAPQAPAVAAAEADDPALELELASDQLGSTSSPEKAHRARKFYLSGVKLLYDPPRVEAAIREFQLAIQTDPLFYKAHFKLGICYYHKGQYELEIAEYNKCLSINPLYVPAWLNLGHAYLAQDRLEQAREAYRKVLELQPGNPVALYNLGLVEFDLRQFDHSYEHLDLFLKVDGSGEMGERAKMYLEEIRLKKAAEGS